MLRMINMIQRQKKGVYSTSLFLLYARTISFATFSGFVTKISPSNPSVIGVSTKPGLTVSTWIPRGASRLRSP